MEFNQLCNVYIAYAITVGQHKRLIADIRLNTFNATASHSIQAGINNRYLPRFRIVIMHRHFVAPAREVERYIRSMQKIICKIFLDHVLLVACTDDKFIVAVMRIQLHDMP